MTNTELQEIVKEMIASGVPLHGLAREIAIDMALEKKEKEEG